MEVVGGFVAGAVVGAFTGGDVVDGFVAGAAVGACAGGDVVDGFEANADEPTVNATNIQRPNSPKAKGITPCRVRHPMVVVGVGNFLGSEFTGMGVFVSSVDNVSELGTSGLRSSKFMLTTEPTSSSTHDLQFSFSVHTIWQFGQTGLLHLVQNPVTSIVG